MIKNQSQQWWRWVLMPFAAVGGALIGAILFTLVQWFGMKLQGGYSEDGWMFLYVLPLISSVVFGWLYVYISCAVAPSAKAIAGIIMTTILVMISVFFVSVSWLIPSYTLGQSIQQTVGAIASTIAAIATMVSIHSESSRE